MEKPKPEKTGQFNRKFAAFVGKLPFPGRHTVGPAVVHALRTPVMAEKLADRQRIAGFRLSNRIIGSMATISASLDIQYMFDDAPAALTIPGFVLNTVVAVSSAASSRAQTYMIGRIDRSIEAAGGLNPAWEAGIDQPVADRKSPVPYVDRWTPAIEKRDTMLLATVAGMATVTQLGIVGYEIVNQLGQGS